MQPTILNKIVSLFLVGGIVVLGIAVIAWRHWGPVAVSTGLLSLVKMVGDNTIAVLGGLLGLSLAAVCGAACESLTDVMVRPLVKRAAASERWSKFFRQTQARTYHDFWLGQFQRVVFAQPAYKNFPQGANDHGLAVGILYRSKQSEAIAWAESHYSTYVMASNLALLSGLLLFYVTGLCVTGWCSWKSGISGIVAALGLLYIFSSLSVDRYLYSYQVALRQSVIALAQPEESEPEKPRDGTQNQR